MDYEYVKNGEEIIFFLHGWGGDKNSFSLMKNHITSCSMVFVSFSGFGDSPPPKTPYTVLDYANELKSVIIKIAKGKKVNIVCHSFGARVAVKLIYNYPDLIKNLIIVDGAGLKPRRKIRYYYNVFKYKKLKRMVDRGKKSSDVLFSFGSSDYKKLSGVMKKTFINVVNEDLKVCYKNVNCKTLIFWGEKDTETPLYMAKKMHKLIKNSQLFIVKNAGHFSYLDDIDGFIYKLTEFLF